MTTTDPLKGFGTMTTPQTERVPGRDDQVENNAGGFVFQINPMQQFRRFLTMGTTGGTYYVGQKELTKECGELVLALTKDEETQKTATDILVELSLAGRAPKQNPTLFALAIFCQHGTTAAKQYARKQITKVVRTGTHLFIFVGYLKQFGGWSRGLRKAVGNWYVEKDADQLAYQMVKYRRREGFTHRDVLRMTHPKIDDPSKRAAIDWTLGKPAEAESVPNVLYAHDYAMRPDEDVVKILNDVPLPWEALPDSAMNDPKVWDKMLDDGVPMTALIRQLGRLTRIGLLPQIGGRTDEIVAQLTNPEALAKARIHPFNVLVALRTYQQGHGFRGSDSWSVTAKIVDALDEAYYLSFRNVVPTNKRVMNALDVSASMGIQATGLPLSSYEVAAALAMVTVRTEPNHMTTAFTSHNSGWGSPYSSELIEFPLSRRQRLDDVLRSVQGLPHRGTDCALPMIEALHKGWEIDAFVIYTDNETRHGQLHPYQALAQYRKTMGIDAKLVVVSITPTKFSIADPRDPGMLDISGFDSAVPTLISDFIRGDV